ncbi:tripartite tricarboxylate transporter permease [Aliiroseovarius subalbicans]|uniref:tripartite tricarboxylate transporter permease n=1 Tax=Aliiroseovarius subalbicans TaxID=2925840 RepID=UPI001F5A0017|nr:tripartite tricarboxylate transporter permease [Aliiroseovarius subalbicans]MCI2400973.1 tripartite tricarboxylate transporter permease [Aliiroseovarius subalbicans]
MDVFALGLDHVLTMSALGAIFIGTILGVAVGVLPGLGSVIGITMVLPFTYSMGQIPALALMLGIYCGSVYGGSISAIVINTPGTPQAAATALDGFPMAQRGDADLAIGWATAASVIGGLFSVVVLIIAAPQLAAFSLNFTSIEYFALGIFALICIANVSRGAMAKGLLAGAIGLFLATIGVDHVTGDMRFTFGSFEMTAGISLIPAIVGLFALSEVFMRASESATVKAQIAHNVGFRLPPFSQWMPRLWLLLKSCTIGSFVGTLPGTGAATAAFIAYSEAKRSAPNRDKLGTGEPDGLVAAESANNAVTGSAMVPTLALGIPGDPVTAVMLGTFIVHGITPGPRLFTENLDLVYAIFLILIGVNILMFFIGALGSQLFTRALRMPEPLLMTMVTVIAIVGAYGVRGNPLDLITAFLAGVGGFILRKAGFPLAPLVIGMVLSQMIENSLRQGLLLTRGSFLAFFERPIALTLFILTALMLAWPAIRWLRARRQEA